MCDQDGRENQLAEVNLLSPSHVEMTMHLLGSFSENWVRWQKIQKGALMSRAAFPALKVGAVLLLFQHCDTYSLPSALSGR